MNFVYLPMVSFSLGSLVIRGCDGSEGGKEPPFKHDLSSVIHDSICEQLAAMGVSVSDDVVGLDREHSSVLSGCVLP